MKGRRSSLKNMMRKFMRGGQSTLSVPPMAQAMPPSMSSTPSGMAPPSGAAAMPAMTMPMSNSANTTTLSRMMGGQRYKTMKNNVMKSRRNNTMKTNMSGGAKKKAVGSKAQVWHGTADHTVGGLKKSDLMKHKGRIVSRRKHALGKKAFKRLVKAGFKPKKGTFKLFRK